MWDQLVELVRGQLENQFLAGGVTIAALAALWATLRGIPVQIWTFAKRHLVTTIDFADHDQTFYWVQAWLDRHPYTKRSRLLTASTRRGPMNKGMSQEAGIEIILSPAPGKHFFFHKGHLVLLTRERSKSDLLGDLAYRETITLQSLSKTVVQAIIEEAKLQAVPPNDCKINLYKPSWNDWTVVQRRDPRPLESVVTEGEIAKDLLEDIQWFNSASQWYADRGIPYQRGYLLEGPPGNGKTSLIVAIASALKRDLYMVPLSAIKDENLGRLMSSLPDRAIAVIEDIDGSFNQRDSLIKDLSFSAFINAIDGASAPSGRILFVTTNHVERLDPALIRPGRTDRRIHVGNATPDQARRMFLRFFPEETQLSEVFEANIKAAPIEYSMATLQEHLIKNREEVQSAARAPTIVVADPAPVRVVSLVPPSEGNKFVKG